MKGRSKASKTKQDKDSTMSSPIKENQLVLPLFATVESVPTSKETTCSDKLSTCKDNIQTQKSSKILEADLTLNAKVYSPYWSDLCAEISSKLLLPVVTDSADLALKFLSSWYNKTVALSWFSQTLYIVQNLNLPQIFLPFSMSSPVECTDLEATGRKSRKIRIFLNPEQRAIVKQWFGVSRYVYNWTIDYLQQPNTKANWKSIKTDILNRLPEWTTLSSFSG